MQRNRTARPMFLAIAVGSDSIDSARQSRGSCGIAVSGFGERIERISNLQSDLQLHKGTDY